MTLEWDERKRRSNFRKHRLDFAKLEQMFEGRLVEENDERREYGERRIKAIGELNGMILSVVYTWRGNRRRLISARRARVDERTQYEAKLAAG